MTGRFAGKTAIVTGAASGIGMATVERLLADGASVIATDLSQGPVPDGDRLRSVIHDVRDEAGWDSVVSLAQTAFGGVDIVVNNAGVSATTRLPVAELPLEEWHHVLSINLDGVFLGTRAGMRAMADRGGAIVNIGSVHSFVAAPGTAAYSTSKGAVVMLTKVAAVEGAKLPRPIRVNSVHPGYIETPLVAVRFGQVPALRDHVEGATPLGRLGRAEEVAGAITYLCSNDAGYVTGTTLTLDGGLTAI